MTLAPGVLTAAACLALAVPLLLWSFTAQPDAVRRRAVANLQRGLTAGRDADDGPQLRGGTLVRLARRLTPTGSVRTLDRLLGRAGRPASWPLERVIVLKMVSTAGAAGFAFLLVGGAPALRTILLAAFVLAFVWFMPELLLYNAAIKRRDKVQLALPDTLDQLTIAVEAGLGFEAAMAHVARNSQGPLADELLRTLQDIQVGQPRRDAYTALTERVAVPDLRRFVRAIVQAEKHGVSVAKVLETQADEMRLKRRQRAEEKAMQIPVKVVFPLVLFILPALFIVILGPAAINIIEVFS
ncbi:type II secretion system F family protein [Ornithinimicrobium pekingense]|uniref:Type II secretion system protein n=1 Tax=Ornithinimicrobium pekingense TaxID=384677 RepID=A0ABQ2F7E5_9MICO|nr:type II secretion system F family protein [Ornithinimicrobium pekingense]GGK68698.1 type II secretion system protein [Ornithinimicrobium pekingense]